MLHLLDNIILGAYLLLILLVGVFYRRAHRSSEDFFVARRSMGMLPIGLSIMVTSFSAINFVAIPEEVCGHGLAVCLSFVMFFLVAWPISRYWMPFFHKQQCISAYEFLEKRFSRRVRCLCGGIFLLWRFVWMAVALYLSGKILAAFSGGRPTALILLCGVVATAYTFLGGMAAVMWTDVIQFCVLLLGILACIFFVLPENSGALWETLRQGERLRPFIPPTGGFFTWNPQVRMTFWSVLIGTAVTFLTRYGADQLVMQRYFTARNLKQAQRGIWLNAVASFCTLSLLAFLGLLIYSHAVQHQGVSLTGPLPKGFLLKQLVAICHQFPKGITGLLIAGILASTMSSVDSGINSCSASLVDDFQVSHRHARLLTLLTGCTITALALVLLPWLNRHQSIFVIINRSVNGIGSPLLAVVLCGMLPRPPRESAVFYGGILGLLLSLISIFLWDNLAIQYYPALNLLLTCCAIGLFAFPLHRK